MANFITISRAIFVFIGIAALYTRTVAGSVAAAALILTAIILDGVDGYIARARGSISHMGSMLDIMSDRIVECSLWIVFVHLGLAPVWVALLIVVRGLVTDTLHASALEHGQVRMGAFGKMTFQTTGIGRLLVESPLSRTGYAVIKAVTFAYLSLLAGAPLVLQERADLLAGATRLGAILVYITLAFCLIRGIPVVWEGMRIIRRIKGEGTA